MILPKSTQNQQGQILVIFLLVLVVGLALVLSIASRTVTDIRQTTTSDETNRAYFAAESGVEKALREIEGNASFGLAGPVPVPVDLSIANRTKATATVSRLDAPQGVVLDYKDLSLGKDDVVQVNMLTDFNNLATRCNNNCPSLTSSIDSNDSLTFSWGAVGTTYNVSNLPALEVSVITLDLSGTNWRIYKMTFDPLTTRTNGFCKPTTSTGSGIYKYSVILKLNERDAAASCSQNDRLSNDYAPVLIRVKFLYGAPKHFGVASLDKDLPAQGQKITSIGEAPSGVTRKIVVDRYFPALPGLFDYALFSGSSSPLCKPCP